ncbi:MAG: CDP-alcohol phosphatidyltransferase family protein [Thermoplasmatales archaeon]|nr:CDP-alcohol phosphatidyltransferase family protein [Thermoplasmatales archaeon]
MVLDGQRDKAEGFLEPVARRMIDVNPNHVSWAALIVAFVSGALLYLSFDNHWLLIAASVAVLVSGYFDALDGKIAKMAGKASRRGDYLDHVFDRFADVFMIGGVAVSAWCDPYLGMLALVGVLLTSYMGTQAQAVGAPRLYAGLLGRADRIVLMTLFPILQFVALQAGQGSFVLNGLEFTVMEIMMGWFALVGNLTAVQRVIVTWRAMSREDP